MTVAITNIIVKVVYTGKLLSKHIGCFKPSVKISLSLTSSEANFNKSHPICLTLHALGSKLKNFSVRKEYLEIAVAAGTNGDNVFHGDSVFECSLPWVEYKQLVGDFATWVR